MSLQILVLILVLDSIHSMLVPNNRATKKNKLSVIKDISVVVQCFKMKQKKSTVHKLSVTNRDIQYKLFTKYNKKKPVLLANKGELEDDNSKNRAIIRRLGKVPLKVLSHGYMSSSQATGGIRDEYLKTRDVNVVEIDWSPIAKSIHYPTVAEATVQVGKRVAKFLDALAHRYSIENQEIHLIGHSLGAHVMGKAASYARIKIDRITGLDPAGPCFENGFLKDHALRKQDAEFVDVIHTDRSGSMALGTFGPIGHADFYPNAGGRQPGCWFAIGGFDFGCSHTKAIDFYKKSISHPKIYPSFYCQNWRNLTNNKCSATFLNYMGDSASFKELGTFFLKTD